MSKTTIYLTRHAQSIGNANYDNGIFTHKDPTSAGSDLSELGFTQAQTLSQQLKDVPFASAYSSDLLRAIRTAQIIIEEKDIPFTIIPDLKERRTGSLGGKTALELKEKYPYILGNPLELTTEQMWEWKLFEDMETAREAVTRMKEALDAIAKEQDGKTVLVVSHGNAMRNLLVLLKQGSFANFRSGTIPNCSYIVLEYSSGTCEVKELVGITKYNAPEDITKLQQNEQL